MWIIFQIFIVPILSSLLSIPWSINLNSNHNELNSLKRFRQIVSDVLKNEYERSDDYLMRWLQDSEMDINTANIMLRKAVEWRKENEMDSILNKTFLPINNHPCFIDGFDKNGGPILIYKLIGVDLRKLIGTGHANNIIRHSDQCIERFIHASIRENQRNEISMTPGVTIADVQGYNMKQHGCFGCITFYRQLAMHSNLFYPRSSKYVVILNVPRSSKPILDAIIPLLSPYFQKTIHVFGSDKKEWSTFLLSIISKEELLEEYGGTRTRIKNIIN